SIYVNKCKDSVWKSRIAEGQNILSIVVIQIVCVGIEITAEKQVFLADLIVDASNARIFVICYLAAESDLTAIVLCSGKTMGEVERRRRELGFIDTVDRIAIGIRTEILDWSP